MTWKRILNVIVLAMKRKIPDEEMEPLTLAV